MDGNGRWAKRRGLPRTEGHTAGEEALAALGEIDRPRPGADHSRSIPLMVLKPKNAPVPACAEDPLAGFDPNEVVVASSSR